jgi:hypothetical protein
VPDVIWGIGLHLNLKTKDTDKAYIRIYTRNLVGRSVDRMCHKRLFVGCF